MAASTSAPSGSPRDGKGTRSQTWVLIALLVAVGLCAALWKVVESWGGSTRRNHAEDSRGEAELVAHSASPTSPELTPAKSEQAQPIAPSEPSAVAIQPPAAEPKIRLFGSILNARDRTPITSDGRVRIADEEWEERTQSQRIDGRYEFVDLHAGSWDITVEVPGFHTLRTHTTLDRDEKEKKLDLLLPPAFMVKVRVEKVGGEELQMTPIGDHLLFTGLRRDAVREAATPDERWTAMLSPEYLEFGVVPTVIEPGRWLDGDSERTSRIGRFVARVTTSSNGTDRARERLKALGYSAESDRRTPRLSDGSNLGELPSKYCGVLELSEEPPAFASLVLHDFVLRTVPIPLGADEVAFSLSRAELRRLIGTVRLRVTDADSDARPEGLAVHFEEAALGTRGTNVETDGSITFANLLPGPAKLSLTAPEREIVIERVFVQPGATTDLGTYRMQPFASVEARVVDDAGEPASALFNVFPSDRYESTRTTLATRFFRSSREGALKIDSVGHGQYLIVAHDENWISSPVLADTSFRQKESLQIRVSKGTSVVLRLRADPPPNGRLAIRTRSGLPVADRSCRTCDPMRFQLAPGNYSVELSDGETWLWSAGLAVGADPVRSYLPR